MRIKNISIANFRGIKKLTLTPEGKNISIYGKNGSGKTTVLNAITWLLFNKIYDSEDEYCKFTVQNNDSLDQDSIIELELMDGTKFKKSNIQKITQKRGSLEKIYEGNTNKYYINDVPKKMKDYNAEIAKIADENTFKLLTNPLFFGSLDWKEKRRLILNDEKIDLKTDTELIDSLKATTTKISKDIDEIDIRIKENKDKLNNYEDVDFIDLEVRLKELNREKAELEDKRVNNNKKMVEKNEKIYKEIEELQTEIAQINNKSAENQTKKRKKLELERQIEQIKSEIVSIKNTEEHYNSEITEKESQIEDLRIKFDDIKSKKYIPGKCSMCEQQIGEEFQTKFREEFEVNQNKQLDKIMNEGVKVKNEIKQIKDMIQVLNEKISEKQQEIIYNESTIDNIDLENEITIDVLMSEVKNEVVELQKQIIQTKSQNEEDVILKIQNIEQKINETLSLEAQAEEKTKIENRIKDLEETRKKQSQKFLEAKNKIVELEKQVKKKIEEITKKVSEDFPEEITFKLFEEQKNGGIKETFDILYNGVAWNEPLNPGGKITTGLNVIKVLQKKYNLNLPVLIDNCEGYSGDFEKNMQIISTYVTKGGFSIKYG